MAMPNNLMKREGTYYARIYIPLDLRPAFDGKKEKWQSLRTKEPREARARLAAVMDEWAGTFADMRKRSDLDESDIQAAVFDHYNAKVEQGDRDRMAPREAEIWKAFDAAVIEAQEPHPAGPGMFDAINKMTDVEILFNKTKWAARRGEARLNRLRADLGSGDTRLIEPEADRFIREKGFRVSKGSDQYRNLCLGLVRAEIEALQRTKEREAGDFTGQIRDPIIAVPLVRREVPADFSGETIMELYDRFAKENPNGIRPETLIAARRDVQLFADFAGPRTPIQRITKKLVGDFKSLLFQYPSRAALMSVFKGMTPQQIVETNAALGKPALDHKTVNKTLSSLSSFCSWLHDPHGMIDNNPVAGFMKKPKGVNARKEKRATFTMEQLTILFNSPLFTGAASAEKWSKFDEPGDHVIRDHRYWIWLMMLYSGARPAEVAQLELSDFDEKDGIWFMNIADQAENQRVKREASGRRVPIHSELIRLGLRDHHAANLRAGLRQLFPELVIPKVGQIARQFSTESNRYLEAIGLKTKAMREKKERNLVTYSLRHTFIDQARDPGGFMNEQIALIVGHDESFGPRNKGQTESYGQLQHGTLEFRRNIVESVRYPLLNLEHLTPAHETIK